MIVRSKNSERTIERTLRIVRAQTIEAEIIVVDSGSRDRTLEIARRWGDQSGSHPPSSRTAAR